MEEMDIIPRNLKRNGGEKVWTDSLGTLVLVRSVV